MKTRIKMNMIVGKKQIVLAALVLCLSLAVYLNWVYSGSDIGLPVTSALEDKGETKNYGDSQYVDLSTDSFFCRSEDQPSEDPGRSGANPQKSD